MKNNFTEYQNKYPWAETILKLGNFKIDLLNA